MKNYFTVLFLVATASTIFGQDFGKQVKEFETYIENARKEWQVPGMAVAVVKEGKVIFKKGFGIRQVGTNQLVDTQTDFCLCFHHQSDDSSVYGHVGGRRQSELERCRYQALARLQVVRSLCNS